MPETRVEKGSGYDLHLIKRREGLGSIRDPYNFLQYEITPGQAGSYDLFSHGSLGQYQGPEMIAARLEVSGTTVSNKLKGLLKRKSDQSRISDNKGHWPAFAIVVDFPTPQCLIAQRHGTA